MNDKSPADPDSPVKNIKAARFCFVVAFGGMGLVFLGIVLFMAQIIILQLASDIYAKNYGVSSTAVVTEVQQQTRRYTHSSETLNIHTIKYGSGFTTKIVLDQPYSVNSKVNIIYNKAHPTEVLQGSSSMSIWQLYFINSEAHGNLFSFIYLHGVFLFLLALTCFALRFTYINGFTKDRFVNKL